jgi:hypothetical protein
MEVRLTPNQFLELREDGGAEPKIIGFDSGGNVLCDVPETKLLPHNREEIGS